MMYAPIKKLSRVNATLQQAMAASERIFEMLDTHSEVPERADAQPLPRLRQAIEFRNVSFSYDGVSKTILQDVSFSVRAGQVVAIVGLSGAGKTTLVNLIPRFYDVTAGGILIDGIDIRDVTLASLRSQIGIVTQDTVLFDDTIAGNIAYGIAWRVDAQEIEAAAAAAHAHEFIVTLPEQYETRIGERGQRLSGRPAPAPGDRAGDPPELAHPDSRRGDVVARRRIGAAGAGRAADADAKPHVVRHRASACRRCGAPMRSSCSSAGRVAEIGRHDELLARPGGVYAKLYALQIFDTRATPHSTPVRRVPSVS